MTKENTNQIVILTDSAADIPSELLDSGIIRIIPLHVIIDGHHYLDGIDISSKAFYPKLKAAREFPKTAPPSEEDFHQIFMEHIGTADILGIFLSGNMSQAVNLANKTKMKFYYSYMRARAASPGKPKRFHMEFIDSKLVSMGTGLLVIEAAAKVKEGWAVPEIKKHIEHLRERMGIYLIVDNLDHLVRGGRIGMASAMVGKLLNFKPLLGMQNGSIFPKAKIMGSKRAYKKIIELMEEELKSRTIPLRASVCSAGADDEAEILSEMVQKTFPDVEIIRSDFGPGVGTHTGPGALGIAFLPSETC